MQKNNKKTTTTTKKKTPKSADGFVDPRGLNKVVHYCSMNFKQLLYMHLWTLLQVADN